jgi:hypothetical protein
MLAERQLRAAEIALDTTRRERRKTEETLRLQQLLVDDAEAALAANLVDRQRDAADFLLLVAAAKESELLAEQKYISERNRRLDLEQQIAALRQDEITRDELARQLAAEARIQALEGELELVSRRAAEFEYGVRMAAFDAFKLVRDLSDVVNGLLQKAGILEPSRSPRVPRDELLDAGAQDPRDRTAQVPAPSVGAVLDSQRLDAALERLRATLPPREDDQ